MTLILQSYSTKYTHQLSTVQTCSIQFNSKHFIQPAWSNFITLRQACEDNKTRMDNKLRQGYKHAVKKKKKKVLYRAEVTVTHATSYSWCTICT